MPLADVLSYWHRLTELRWSMQDENLARLLDILEWRADIDWQEWTTPPEELSRQRALARRKGIRPPAHPPIPPAALRPEPVTDQRVTLLRQLYESTQPVTTERWLTAAELDAFIA